MTYLMKREYYLFNMYLLFILFYVPINYVMNLPITYPIMMGLIFSLYNLFYYDTKNNVNRTLVSLPIKKELIVGTRYIFLFIVLTVFILYQWLIDRLAHGGLPYLDSAPLNSMSVILLFMTISFILAISIPIFYFFQTFTKAVILHVSLLFILVFSFAILIGNPYIDSSRFILFIFNIIEIQPFVVPFVLSIICLYFSYKLSVWIFSKKEIL